MYIYIYIYIYICGIICMSNFFNKIPFEKATL